MNDTTPKIGEVTAFPSMTWDGQRFYVGPDGEIPIPVPSGFQTGMDLRDYFAAKALAAVLEAIYRDVKSVNLTANEAPAFAADTAYQYADAMLAARKAAR